jgi:hypothetical protein
MDEEGELEHVLSVILQHIVLHHVPGWWPTFLSMW